MCHEDSEECSSGVIDWIDISHRLLPRIASFLRFRLQEAFLLLQVPEQDMLSCYCLIEPCSG